MRHASFLGHIMYVMGDIHFLWELTVANCDLLGSITTFGSIRNLRERFNQTQLDNNTKVLSIADDFVILLAAVYSMFGISVSAEWLQSPPSIAVEGENR